MKKSILITVSLLALGACGGGGGGGDTTGGGGLDFSNPVALQPGQSLDDLPEGVAVSAPVSAVTASITNTGTFGEFSGPQAGTVVASAERGEDGPAAFRYTVGGTTVQFDGDVEESSDLNGAVGTATDADGTIEIFMENSDLEFVEFGGWGQFPADDSDPAVGTPIFFGTIGAPIASPTSGNATYTGKSVGIDNGGGTIRLTTSDMSVNTDFSTVTVTSSNTLTQDVGSDIDTVPVPDPSLDFTTSPGTVSSTGYTATAGGMNVNGAFFGPNAEETGGTFHGVSGAGTNYGGAFAAAQ